MDDSIAAVHAHGEIDAANADRFCDYVLGLAPDCQHLMVDLSELTFLGTEGFSALRRIRSELVDTSWVVVSSPAVARILRVCDRAGEFTVAGSVEAALALLRDEPGRHLVSC
ncbi:STAS domain-containing protein [[Mycobacterium] wendilense]|uniref:STAS domain-containing protein n=1 Tax=[Mycobacterium] wendilense TaxID=3064284 RepID=A0ABN9P6G3_9MYCO|nr:STAS domain-containing protein [Mycolicibacterium sp. MU0050]CAJ1586636.1 STAS domain-containing protein [Mycolicibacterium sp. MU0050]